MSVGSKDGIPFLDFDGNQYVLLPDENTEDAVNHLSSAGGSFSSIKFGRLEGSNLQNFNRLFERADNEEIAGRIRSTLSSSLGTSSNSLQSAGKASSIQEEARGLLCCIKEKKPFHITCHTNTNYALSGYGREIRIKYRQDDLFLMGYSVALLDFLYKNKNNEANESEKGYLPIVLKANEATSEEDFNKILQNRASLEAMIVWFKTVVNPGDSYRFDKQSLPAIQRLFNAVGMPIDLTKQKQPCFPCPGFKPDVEEILKGESSCGELIMRSKNKVSYFSN